MKTHPIAKINLGLNIVSKRPDGYHNLETVFFPVRLCDTLEVNVQDDGHATAGTESNQPSVSARCQMQLSGIAVEGNPQKNLVVKAYDLLAEEFPLPPVVASLHKQIPTQAGMGGGSSDATAMLVTLNEMFHLGLSEQQLIERATRLGADCPFFVKGEPAYAEGIGERLQPVSISLKGWLLAIVKPPVAISTKEAFMHIRPSVPLTNCRRVVEYAPVERWPGLLVNDFEMGIFALHPQLAALKETLYRQGAAYAAMSGSGSALFGLFSKDSIAAVKAGNASTTALQDVLQQRLHSAIPADCQLFIVSIES